MFLTITLRFLDHQPTFHGRADGGEPEWPPSPLRLFQALVDAAASRWRGPRFDDYARHLLQWLEMLSLPTIIAPAFKVGTPVRIAVPNNDLDVWAGPLSRAATPKKQPNELKTMKTVRPTHLLGDAVHYLYPIADAAEFAKHRETLIAAARSITHLGWGVDMVAGNAVEMTEEEVAKLPGERWLPTKDSSGVQLRIPRTGTLEKLMEKHEAFLNRLSGDGFKPVPPLTAFKVEGYRRETDPAARPWAAFRIASINPDDRNPSFDTPRRCRDVAAWVRCAVAKACEDWPFPEPVASFIHGHDATETTRQLKGDDADRRFMYLPLPTINPLNRVESIRRVLIAAPSGCEDRIEWLRRRLPGQELIALDDSPRGMLIDLKPDWVVGQYTQTSRVWSTVTPVVLPGYDDPNHLRRRLRENRDAAKQQQMLIQLDTRVEGLIRKAMRQAGISDELEREAIVEWRAGGFRAGTVLTSQYARPENLNAFAAYHVRVRFRHPVRGPLAIGAGRYRGLGLFAAE